MCCWLLALLFVGCCCGWLLFVVCMCCCLYVGYLPLVFFCWWCHCLDVACCLSYVVCCGIVTVCCELSVLVFVVRCVLAGC